MVVFDEGEIGQNTPETTGSYEHENVKCDECVDGYIDIIMH